MPDRHLRLAGCALSSSWHSRSRLVSRFDRPRFRASGINESI
jgi:hypothetical protein